MREEIFGPILPVVPYDSLDEAIGHVNAGERPLGLYVFAADEQAAQDVLDRTVSGGAASTPARRRARYPRSASAASATAAPAATTAIDGFREFSNPRGVVFRGEGGVLDAFLPPYGEQAKALLDGIFGSRCASGMRLEGGL